MKRPQLTNRFKHVGSWSKGHGYFMESSVEGFDLLGGAAEGFDLLGEAAEGFDLLGGAVEG
jgi:hypothetical protein